MRYCGRGAHALFLGSSVVAVLAGMGMPASAQTTMLLDTITVTATKTPEKAIDSLSAISAVGPTEIKQIAPSRLSDVFFGMPGVTFQERSDSPATAINVRGLQDFGRVAVVVDGARQNFQATGHNANGTFYLDPELLAGVDVVRGPVSNIFGSGAIGGVAAFRTKDVGDVLRGNERLGVVGFGEVGSNVLRGVGSLFAAGRPSDNVELFVGGVYRTSSPFHDGNGSTVANSGFDLTAGIAKATVRPADGHEVKFSSLTQGYDYVTGQFSPVATNSESQYQTRVKNDIASASWRYARPDDQWLDFENTVYWTRTSQDQRKIANSSTSSRGNAITGSVGDSRSFEIDTTGFDLHNTSRLETGPLRHAVTYGVDYFRDKVQVTDATGTGDLFTPSGQRDVYGGFMQWKTSYQSWLDVITAARYDAYQLDGGTVGSDGDRLSPKVTVGVTPMRWFTVYGTYAEGYRAPALTETLVAGAHPPFASFPGAPAGFTFVPNPDLRPEVGRNKEIGVNIRGDDLLVKGDALRIKANVFRNDVEDFIDLVAYGPINPVWGLPSFQQYRNVANARLEGVEAEATYDAGRWFASLSGQHIRGHNVDTGAPLLSVQPDQVAATLGARFLDQKLTVAMRWAHVTAKTADEIPDNDRNGTPDFTPTRAYNLVKLYIGYEPKPDVLTTFTVDNLLNEQYTRYLDYLPSEGITFKGGLRIRFGV